MSNHFMPIRGERGSPTFDQSKPNTLGRYFTQLEQLFTRCKIETDAEKKQYAASYIEPELADSWEALPEYADDATTYLKFKEQLFELYNQVGLRYILSDLDMLVGERQRIGMKNLQDLMDFHLRFNTIASYLLASQLISAREQSQAYLRVFDKSLQARVIMRLQIKFPNHHPAMPYTIPEIYEAAKWVLQGVPNTFNVTASTHPVSNPASTSNAQDTGFIKAEQFGTFLNEFAKTIVDALQTSNSRNRPSGPSDSSAPRNLKCNFDGCERFIRDCPAVDEYIKQGKCKRNHEGKVILPSGAFVPRDIPGQNLRDRIDEWHRRNPNQLAAGSLFNAIVSTAQVTIPTIRENEVESNNLYQLSAQERIASLEAEIFNLKVRHQPGFVPIIKTRKQRAAEPQNESDDKAAEPSISNKPVEKAKQPEPRSKPVEAVPITSSSKGKQQEVSEPEHPFRNAKEAVYIPPQTRNIGAPAKVPEQPSSKKSEPAYRTLPSIHDVKIATDVYQRALETPFTITYHELLSLSPEVRAQVRDAITSKRVANKEVTQANSYQNVLTPEELSYVFPDELPYLFDDEDKATPIMALTTADSKKPDETKNAIVIEDPIDQYYKGLGQGDQPDPNRIIVAKESLALRSIVPLIDNHLKVESILDPGCQIVAMSEEVCHELALPYDPTIVLHMQSANGAIDPSLGLARNVPFHIGDLTFYMQVHVIRNPAYDILLGRPFDILTESVVRNFRNEDQTITIHDPNSNRVATIPTIPRGPPRFIMKTEVPGFFTSRG
jgi:hypothetical protein